MKIKQTLKAAGIFFAFSVLVLPSIFTVIASSPVSAAGNNADAACRALIATPSSGIKPSQIPANFPNLVQCKTGYNAGYSNPTQLNPDAPSGPCNTSMTNIGMCDNGYRQGIKDANAAKVTPQNPKPTPASINTKAQNLCAPEKKQKGVSASIQQGDFNACVACYTVQANSGDITTKIGTYTGSQQHACLAGEQAAKDGKSAVPGAAVNPNNPPSTTTPAASTGNDNKQLSCDVEFASPLTWIICPVVDILVSIVNGIDGIITNTLNVGTGTIFCTSGKLVANCDSYHQAWASFRNIALGIMVIAGLIVVIAQAMGTELLDAYTIRKILPRILVAAIAITLSWSIMKFAVQLSDDLGFGVRQLIYAPFVGIKNDVFLGILGGGVSGFFGGLGVAGVAAVGGLAAWIVAGGIGVLISYLATAALAVGIAILVLTIRQVFIIMCILISPIAIVLYILPNTNRFYKMWYDNFSKALLMFPLIAAMIATGRVFAAISFSSGDALKGFIGFVSYFAPYFMIPLTFKFAGAAMGSIGGAVHSRGQGARNALTGYRSGQRKSRVNRARTGGLYNNKFGQFGKANEAGERKSIGKLLNKAGDWTVDADERIPLGLGRRGVPGFKKGAAAAQSQIEKQKIDHGLKAAQEADMDWKTGLAAGGLLSKFAGTLDNGQKFGAQRAKLDQEFGTAFEEVEDDQGNKHSVATAWRKPSTFGEMNQMADMLQTGDESSREAAEGLRAKAGYLSNMSVSDETRRADSGFVGLASAAKEGRLENTDIIANHNAVLATSGRETAVRQTTMLQQLSAQKRPSLARGHAIEYATADGTDPVTGDTVKAGEALNVYRTPDSDKAQASMSRMTSQDVAGAKSDDLDGLIGQAWVAGASNRKMVFNKDTKKMQTQRNADGSVLTKAQIAAKDPTNEKAQVEAARAAEFQGRLRTIASYNYGDSDVGRKVKQIWEDAGLKDELGELGGFGTAQQLDPEEAARHAANPPPKPEGE